MPDLAPRQGPAGEGTTVRVASGLIIVSFVIWGVGDMLRVKNEGGEFHVEVLQLSEVRGPASVAQTLYRETEEFPPCSLAEPETERINGRGLRSSKEREEETCN